MREQTQYVLGCFFCVVVFDKAITRNICVNRALNLSNFLPPADSNKERKELQYESNDYLQKICN